MNDKQVSPRESDDIKQVIARLRRELEIWTEHDRDLSDPLAADIRALIAAYEQREREIAGAFYSEVCTDMNIAICAHFEIQDGQRVRILREET